MKLKERIKVASALGEFLHSNANELEGPIQRAYQENNWFTPENSAAAIDAIQSQFLQKDVLESWANSYNVADNKEIKVVGLVLAGNIPLVGFHDVLSTFISGHKSKIKTSSKDSILLKTLINKLIEIEPASESYFEVTEQLKAFDAVIATGSNNSARYFEQYFGKYPNIIRKNRNAIAVLDGSEAEEDFVNLSADIFNYFGLGCRNVSKLYVPEGYSFDQMLSVLHEGYKEIIHHNKYRNNFDYNNALFLLNKVEFLMSGSLILTESKEIASRIATLHYELYGSDEDLEYEIKEKVDQIQCVVSKKRLNGIRTFNFGEAQQPSITDYADGVDTMEFLKSL